MVEWISSFKGTCVVLIFNLEYGLVSLWRAIWSHREKPGASGNHQWILKYSVHGSPDQSGRSYPVLSGITSEVT